MEPALKLKVDCPCGCGQFGMPTKKRGHPRGCKCRPCINGRNSRGGKAGHRKILRDVGAATAGRGTTSHEESVVHEWRMEIKTGAQAGPVVTRWRLSRDQSEATRSFGDNRPFVAIFDTRKKGDPALAVLPVAVLMELAGIEVSRG